MRPPLVVLQALRKGIIPPHTPHPSRAWTYKLCLVAQASHLSATAYNPAAGLLMRTRPALVCSSRQSCTQSVHATALIL